MIWMGNDLSLINDWETSKGNTPSAWPGDLVKVDWCAWADTRPACGFCLFLCILKRPREGRGWSPWKHSSLTSLTSRERDMLRRWLLSSTSLSLSSISSIFSIQLCLACSRLHSWADLWCAWLQHRYNVQTLSIRRSAKCVLMSACYCNCSLLISIDW